MLQKRRHIWVCVSMNEFDVRQDFNVTKRQKIFVHCKRVEILSVFV